MFWLKVLAAAIFLLIPGFTFKESFEKKPILTIGALIVGFYLLFISVEQIIKDKLSSKITQNGVIAENLAKQRSEPLAEKTV